MSARSFKCVVELLLVEFMHITLLAVKEPFKLSDHSLRYFFFDTANNELSADESILVCVEGNDTREAEHDNAPRE